MIASLARPLRVGLVGAGWAGEQHGLSLREIGRSGTDVTLAAVADADLERAQRLADDHGARAYQHVSDLLAGHEIDALIVATPPGSHRLSALEAIGEGIPVFLEKPVARTLDDAIAIAAAAHSAEVPCAVGYQWRAMPVLQTAREAIDPDTIGVMASRSVGISQVRSWYDDPRQSGGLISERGSHQIDLQCALAGTVSHVQATRGGLAFSGIDRSPASVPEDVVCLTLRFHGGALGQVIVVWAPASYPAVNELSVYVMDGSLDFVLDPAFSLSGRVSGRQIEVTHEGQAPFVRQMSRFLHAVVTRDPSAVSCSITDGVHSLAVALACEQALAWERSVEVSTA